MAPSGWAELLPAGDLPAGATVGGAAALRRLLRRPERSRWQGLRCRHWAAGFHPLCQGLDGRHAFRRDTRSSCCAPRHIASTVRLSWRRRTIPIPGVASLLGQLHAASVLSVSSRRCRKVHRCQARSRSRFLSLKWKILLTLGGVMLSVNGALSWLHFQDLTTRFETQRAETRSGSLPRPSPCAATVGLRLQALAGMLAALDSVGVSLFQTCRRERVAATALRQYWPVLQLDLGIDSLQLYAKDRSRRWRPGPPTRWPMSIRTRTCVR
jgi:hypothetical protein